MRALYKIIRSIQMEEEKIQSIRDYLKDQFPSAEHADKYDFNKMGYKFRITTENHVMLALISKELIMFNNSETIISIIDRINISKLLTSNPKSIVIVTSSGVRIEPRN